MAVPSSEASLNRPFYLPRLAPEFYQGDAAVLWTFPIADRATGWLTDHFHGSFREIMMHALARESLLCSVYVLMPDHIHFVWLGLEPESDQRKGVTFLRRYLGPSLRPAKFQHQAHDHVLKEKERRRNAFANVCQYVLLNPVRAQLVDDPTKWKFCGSVVPGYPTLDARSGGDFWELFWKLFHDRRDSGCDGLVRS